MKSEVRPLILHVIHHLVIGGMENGLVNLINRMPASKFRHGIICIEDYSDFQQRITRPDVEVIAMHRSTASTWSLRYRLYKLFRSLQPSIVHARGMSGLDALLPARLAGVRHCVQGEHGRDVNDLQGDSKKLAMLRRLHSPLISRYIAVSKDLKGYLVKKVGVNERKIEQIYNGVDTDRFTPAQKEPISKSKNPIERQCVIGTVGRLQPVKDQATLISAFVKLKLKYPSLSRNVRLDIVGDGPLYGELTGQIKVSGFEHDISLPRSTDNVAGHMRKFDVFVLPSLAEGISNTILEAMASGVPVLASAVGGNVELVTDNFNGYLFPPNDVDQLTELLASYLEEPARRLNHGLTARKHAVQDFSLESMVQNYINVYESLLV